MNKPSLLFHVAGLALASLLIAGGCGGGSANPITTVTPQPTNTPQPTGTPQPTNTPQPTGTPSVPYDAYQASLSVENARITEGNSGTKTLDFQIKVKGYFAVNSTPVEKDDYKVAFATQDDTATANSDYTPVTTSFDVKYSDFAEHTITVSVPIKGDTTVEPDEALKAVLQTGKRASFATSSNAFARSLTVSGTIINDDF